MFIAKLAPEVTLSYQEWGRKECGIPPVTELTKPRRKTGLLSDCKELMLKDDFCRYTVCMLSSIVLVTILSFMLLGDFIHRKSCARPFAVS